MVCICNMRVLAVFSLCLAVGAANIAIPSMKPALGEGEGSAVDISQYPSVAAMLYNGYGNTFNQMCVSTILSRRTLVTAAHCVHADDVYKWRIRIGSTNADRGGRVHALRSILIHPGYNIYDIDFDIAIVRTFRSMAYSNVVKPASIAGLNYNLPDGQIVWSAGWVNNAFDDIPSDQLRHIQMWTIHQYTCTFLYGLYGVTITDNVLCSTCIHCGTQGQCQGDSGSPIYDNGVLVGVSSWSNGCNVPVFPSLNARVSQFASWIQSNASINYIFD